MKHKYKKGDKVWVHYLPESMSHFTRTDKTPATIAYTYKDKYGGNGTPKYTLTIDGNTTSWYYEENLRPVTKLGEVLE